jgi:hypothetical protein
MSLEQRLEDVNFLEKIAVNAIEDTVLYLKAYCHSKEQFGMNDEHYSRAKDFLRCYNKSKLYGATPEFKENLMTNMMLSTTGNIFRKSLPYLLIAAAGVGFGIFGYKMENSTLVMMGAGFGFGSLLSVFFLPKSEYRTTMLIYQAMQKHPEVVDKALKKLYEKEKNV